MKFLVLHGQGKLVALIIGSGIAVSLVHAQPVQDQFMDEEPIVLEGFPAQKSHRGNWFTKRLKVQEYFTISQSIHTELEEIERACQACQDACRQVSHVGETCWTDVGLSAETLSTRIRAHDQHIQTQLSDKEVVGKEPAEPQAPDRQQEVARLKDQHTELEHIMNEISLMQQITQALSEVQSVIDDQLAKSRAYDQKALELYDQMVQVLSDELVIQLAGHMDALLENMRAIRQYVQADLTDYVHALLEQAGHVSGSILTRIHALQEAGIDVTQDLVQKPEQTAEPAPVPIPSTASWWQRWFGWMESAWRSTKALFGV